MEYRALTGVFSGVPTQIQHETTALWHTGSLQNGWNWIQSVSLQLCHRPTTVIVQLSCCEWVKVDPALIDSHETPFDLKFYYYLSFAFLQYQEIPLGIGLPCQPLHNHQIRWSLSQRASRLSSKWKRRKDDCFRNELFLVKFKVADFLPSCSALWIIQMNPKHFRPGFSSICCRGSW